MKVLQLANALTEKWRLLQQTRRKMDELEGLVDEATLNLRRTNAMLEAEIAQRTRREECLALQQEVTRILADSTATAGEVTAKILETVCERMKWDVGELWTADLQPEILRCTAIWHSPGTEFADFRTATQQMVFRAATDLPGGVWKSGQPAWIPDVTADGTFLRKSAAAKAGLHCGFAFPLRLRGEILGVVEFFSVRTRQPEDDVLEMFATLGSLIAQSIERKKLEERLRQAQKMDAIGQLAGGVAHDFNNILTVIQGYAQILKTNIALDHETADGLTQIALAAERAGNLTQQLLTFSRKRIMQAKSVDLNSVIANLAKMLRRVIGEDMALSFHYSHDCAIIHADEDMLSQVLMNLAVNARDAMPKGGKLGISTELVTIGEPGVQGHADSRPGRFVCLTVTDTGCGIPPENLSRIFEPFFTTKGVGRGTGLGLSTVYGILKQHRGWIEVNSQVGTGSTFRMFLPRVAHLALPANEKSGESIVPGGTETILLVEDEAPVRGLAKRILQRLGYQVLEAASGVDALAVWEQRGDEVHLLVTDMVMPDGITGRDLVEKLQAKRPGLKFIYTSGYSPNGTKEGESLLEGINFLQKPYGPRKLLEAVRERLDGTPGSN